MADWFVTVLPAEAEAPMVVHECVSYREALVLSHTLAERHPSADVELVDCEGRILLSPGFDQWDGTQGRTTVPLRAGLYAWQDASETYRLVSL